MTKLKMVIAGLALPLLMAGGGCDGGSGPGDWLIPATDDHGNARIVTAERAAAYIYEVVYEHASGLEYITIDTLADGYYVIPEHESVEMFFAEFLKKHRDVSYIKDYRDCDNWARRLASDFAFSENPRGVEAQWTIAVIHIPGHALNAVFTDRGLFIFDSLGGPLLIPLDNWPDRGNVTKVSLDI